jgi:hypothetical protein
MTKERMKRERVSILCRSVRGRQSAFHSQSKAAFHNFDLRQDDSSNRPQSWGAESTKHTKAECVHALKGLALHSGEIAVALAAAPA